MVNDKNAIKKKTKSMLKKKLVGVVMGVPIGPKNHGCEFLPLVFKIFLVSFSLLVFTKINFIGVKNFNISLFR